MSHESHDLSHGCLSDYHNDSLAVASRKIGMNTSVRNNLYNYQQNRSRKVERGGAHTRIIYTIDLGIRVMSVVGSINRRLELLMNIERICNAVEVVIITLVAELRLEECCYR